MTDHRHEVTYRFSAPTHLAVLRAALHQLRTGHDGEWIINTEGGLAYMRCPQCGKRVLSGKVQVAARI